MTQGPASVIGSLEGQANAVPLRTCANAAIEAHQMASSRFFAVRMFLGPNHRSGVGRNDDSKTVLVPTYC